jgi:hypothetical protein
LDFFGSTPARLVSRNPARSPPQLHRSIDGQRTSALLGFIFVAIHFVGFDYGAFASHFECDEVGHGELAASTVDRIRHYRGRRHCLILLLAPVSSPAELSMLVIDVDQSWSLRSR